LTTADKSGIVRFIAEQKETFMFFKKKTEDREPKYKELSYFLYNEGDQKERTEALLREAGIRFTVNENEAFVVRTKQWPKAVFLINDKIYPEFDPPLLRDEAIQIQEKMLEQVKQRGDYAAAKKMQWHMDMYKATAISASITMDHALRLKAAEEYLAEHPELDDRE
jgi:transposase